MKIKFQQYIILSKTRLPSLYCVATNNWKFTFHFVFYNVFWFIFWAFQNHMDQTCNLLPYPVLFKTKFPSERGYNYSTKWTQLGCSSVWTDHYGAQMFKEVKADTMMSRKLRQKQRLVNENGLFLLSCKTSAWFKAILQQEWVLQYYIIYILQHQINSTRIQLRMDGKTDYYGYIFFN